MVFASMHIKQSFFGNEEPIRVYTILVGVGLAQSHSHYPVKRHNVTTERFCQVYGLDDGDAILLNEVGFRPGDKTEAALDDELKNIGFTFFSWKQIHIANLRFKADLAAGIHY